MTTNRKLTPNELRLAAAAGVQGLDAVYQALRGTEADADGYAKAYVMTIVMMLDSALRLDEGFTLAELQVEIKEWQSSVRAENSHAEGTS